MQEFPELEELPVKDEERAMEEFKLDRVGGGGSRQPTDEA